MLLFVAGIAAAAADDVLL